MNDFIEKYYIKEDGEFIESTFGRFLSFKGAAFKLLIFKTTRDVSYCLGGYMHGNNYESFYWKGELLK